MNGGGNSWRSRIVAQILNLPVLLVPVLIFTACVGCATQPQKRGAQDFPIIPAVADANPAVRHVVLVRFPTKLKTERTGDTLSISVENRSSLDSTNLTVGSKMVTGVKTELFVYAEGEARPSHAMRVGLMGSMDFHTGTAFLNAKQEGIPAPGKKYVVEMDLSIFETDVPSQHMWMPHSDKYKVLCKRTLKQVIE